MTSGPGHIVGYSQRNGIRRPRCLTIALDLWQQWSFGLSRTFSIALVPAESAQGPDSGFDRSELEESASALASIGFGAVPRRVVDHHLIWKVSDPGLAIPEKRRFRNEPKPGRHRFFALSSNLILPSVLLFFSTLVTCALDGITVLARLLGLGSHAAQGLEGGRVDDTRVIVVTDVLFHPTIPPRPI